MVLLQMMLKYKQVLKIILPAELCKWPLLRLLLDQPSSSVSKHQSAGNSPAYFVGLWLSEQVREPAYNVLQHGDNRFTIR